MLYNDNGEVDGLLTQESPPTTEVTDEYGVRHRMWRVSDPGLVELVRGKMRDKKLIIADGHHRYETALNYRNARRSAEPQAVGAPRERAAATLLRSLETEEAPYDLVMMTFVNMNSPGLVVLPTHRVVSGLPSFSPSEFASAVRTYFNVEEVDPSVDAARATAILREAGHVGTAILAATASQVWLLHTPKAPASMFPGLSIRQQALDVVQLHKVLLEGVLKLSEESIRDQQNLVLHSRRRRSLSRRAHRRRQHLVPDEPLPHLPGPRHSLRRRSPPAKIDRLLPEAPERSHHLRARLISSTREPRLSS